MKYVATRILVLVLKEIEIFLCPDKEGICFGVKG